MARRRRSRDRSHLTDLQLWGGLVDDDGQERVLMGEVSSDPTDGEAVQQIAQIMREQGFTQLAGD